MAYSLKETRGFDGSSDSVAYSVVQPRTINEQSVPIILKK